MDERVYDTGEAENRMVQHASIDKVSNGPKKALYTVIALLIAIAGFTGGLFKQSFTAGEWKGHIESDVIENRREVAENRSRSETTSIQLSAIAASLQSIVIVDSIQNYQIRENARTLERVMRELQAHRTASER
jgi:hypothetical protein